MLTLPELITSVARVSSDAAHVRAAHACVGRCQLFGVWQGSVLKASSPGQPASSSVMKPNHEPNAHLFCGRSLALHSVLQPALRWQLVEEKKQKYAS